MNLYLRTGFRYSKGSYYGTMLWPFQGLCNGNIGKPTGWFLIIYIMILYLKEIGHGFEIKTTINRYELKLVTMMFVDDGDFQL